MIYAEDIAACVYDSILRIASGLRPDVVSALEDAAKTEQDPRGSEALELLLKNSKCAAADGYPLCQDTGTVWVLLEIGEDETLRGSLAPAIDAAVERAYTDAHLRMSVVHDALFDRENTQTNTPAFIEYAFRPGTGVSVHVMLKGGGSDNASKVAMLPPSAGWEGVLQFVVDAVAEKGASACPPLIIGVGVGSTFDKVASLAKHALLAEVGAPAASEEHAAKEQELLGRINSLGIGPGGFGGDTTALSVHLRTAPCHIAALPVAVNVGCSAMRSSTTELV